MTILEKLHEIEKEKIIYNIQYCLAGVGFIFYYPEKDPRKFKMKKLGHMEFKEDVGWREALSVEKYYPTFEEAVEGEYKKLKEV